MTEMIFKVLDELILAVHSSRPPLASEWERYIKEHERLAAENRRVSILVFTEGGGPNSKERSALKAAVPYDAKTAIVTRSVAVRGIVTAFNWLGWSNMEAFSPQQMDDALRYVNAIQNEARVLAELSLLQGRLRGGTARTHLR